MVSSRSNLPAAPGWFPRPPGRCGAWSGKFPRPNRARRPLSPLGGFAWTWVELVGDNWRVGDLVTVLAEGGVRHGDLVGLVVRSGGAVSVATDRGEWEGSAADVGAADEKIRPRWVVWSQEDARGLVAAGVRLATCWDVAAVHRLLFGGWRADPAYAWACLHGQAPAEVPAVTAAPDLFSAAADVADAPALGAPAALAAARLQLAGLAEPGRLGTARAESTAELLCAELSADGLPVGLAAMEGLLTGLIGARPRGPTDAAVIRAERDAQVLRHAPATRATTSAATAAVHQRPAQPRAGEVAPRGGRDRRAGHPRVAARRVQGPLAAGRRPP